MPFQRRTCWFSRQLAPPEPSVTPAVLTGGSCGFLLQQNISCVCVCVSTGASFTSIGGRLDGGWQLDAVVHPLRVTNPTCLAALNSLLHQEAEDVAGVLGACAVPLQTRQHTGRMRGWLWMSATKSGHDIGHIFQFDNISIKCISVMWSNTDKTEVPPRLQSINRVFFANIIWNKTYLKYCISA